MLYSHCTKIVYTFDSFEDATVAQSNIGPPKGYFTPPDSAPKQDIRSLFSDLSNLLLNDLGRDTRDEALEVLKEILTNERYQTEDNLLVSELKTDYETTCRYWDEMWRFNEGWPLILLLLDEIKGNK